MSAGIVPRKARRATVTEMCIQSMRRFEFSVLAMTPNRTKRRPMPAGIRAVGWALPVATKPKMPSRMSRTPKPMVSFAMIVRDSLVGQCQDNGFANGMWLPRPDDSEIADKKIPGHLDRVSPRR